ncbi:Crp/Fnr family transcriptional regulator [Streptomyces sp. NPDC004610]|uniref:Crp/Fnr family transcriptional regulator n=1 Tax=unclassified Streptomyces TaxID=2593676 RepID=UPI0033A673E7
MSKDASSSVRTFRDLVSAGEWAELTRAPARPRAADEVLLRQGDPGTQVIALISGLVKVVHVDRDGRQRLLAFRGPGEILGEMALQHGGGRLAYVRAMSECKVAIHLATDFREFVGRHGLAPRIAELVSLRLREQTEVHDGAVHERLALALLRLFEISGERSFSVTRDELGQHIGVSRNYVTKALEHLGPDLVRFDKNRIEVISPEGLRKI